MSGFTAFGVKTYMDDNTQIFIRQVRRFMQDYPGLNSLLQGEELKDSMLELFVDMAMDDWSTTPPVVNQVRSVEAHPSRYLLMLKVVTIALKSCAMLYARNNLNYSDGGVQLATADRAPVYMQIAQVLEDEYQRGKIRLLKTMNAEQAYGGVHSEYLMHGGVGGYNIGSLDGMTLLRMGFGV